MKRIVIGFGTGRCGTKSLAQFLSQQPGVNIRHEWIGHNVGIGYQDMFSIMLEQLLEMDGNIVGDVAWWWYQYLWIPMNYHPGTKAINLWRHDEEVIESFWHYKKQGLIYGQQGWYSYPFESDKPTKDAIATQIRKYRLIEQEIFKTYPTTVRKFMMRDLNDSGKLEELLEWLDFPVEGRVLTPIHVNKQKEVIARNLAPKRVSLINKLFGNRTTRSYKLQFRDYGYGKPWYVRAFRRIKWLLQDVF